MTSYYIYITLTYPSGRTSRHFVGAYASLTDAEKRLQRVLSQPLPSQLRFLGGKFSGAYIRAVKQ